MKLEKWTIFCNVSNQPEAVWLEQGSGPPTKCPVDTSHSVDDENVAMVDLVDNSVQKMQTYIGSFKIALLEFGFNFTATKNSTTDHDKLLPVKYLRGAWIECEDHAFGDCLSFQVCDVDNVLGAGAGYVASEFGDEVQVPKSGIYEVISESISNALPSGLYVRVKYKSVGTSNDVKAKVNCRGYNSIA